ncbi:hypothetical protein LTR95_000614 [Oleoguttula sp. CCFEE 5521]
MAADKAKAALIKSSFDKRIPYELWGQMFETSDVPFAAKTARDHKYCYGHPVDYAAEKEESRLLAFKSSSYDNVRIAGDFLFTPLFRAFGQNLDIHVHLCDDFEKPMVDALLDLLKPCKHLRRVMVEFCPRWNCTMYTHDDPKDTIVTKEGQQKMDQWVRAVEPKVREALKGSPGLKVLEMVKVAA